MSEVASLLEQLRAVAETHGADWLQSQITASLRGVQQGPPTTRPASTRSRRSIPPERFSPDNPPRSQRRVRSPSRSPGARAQGAQRGDSRGSRPSSPVVVRAQIHSAAPAGDAPVGGAARRGKDPPAGAGLARSTGGGLARGEASTSGGGGAAAVDSRQSGGPASRSRQGPGRVDRREDGAQAASAVLRDELIEEFSSDGEESPRGGVAPAPLTTPAVSRGRSGGGEERRRPHGQAAVLSSSSEEGELTEDPLEDGRAAGLSAGGPSRPRRLGKTKSQRPMGGGGPVGSQEISGGVAVLNHTGEGGVWDALRELLRRLDGSAPKFLPR